jgi:multidrug resistance efflux pump
MAEIRKKLSDVQMRQLSETQAAVAQARAVFEKVQSDAQRVVQLVFDAHNVPMHYTADIDQETGELVCTGEDLPAATERGPKLKK